MPSPFTDEEDVQTPEPPALTSAKGASPLVPSAPNDAPPVNGAAPTPFKPTVYERPGPIQPIIHVPWHRSIGIPSPTGSMDPVTAAQDRTNMSRFNANRMFEAQQGEQRKINADTQSDLQARHIQHERNPETGAVEPVRDAEGNIQYRPGKGPIKYDSSGKAIRTEYEESGPKVVELDKNADIGIHPDRPNELYRQNKHAPWDYLGTVAEGLQSKDPAIQKSAVDAQLGLDKQLHSGVDHDLDEEIAKRALDVQGKVKDFHGKAATLSTLNDQLANFDKNNPAINETEGGLFGMGSRPTQTAQVLRESKAAIEKQIADLQEKGYSAITDEKVVKEFAKPEIEALHAARGEKAGWLAPKEPGDFDRLVRDRTAALAEQGRDASTDPILQSLAKRKTALGIGQPSQPSEADRAATAADPLYGPLVGERDQLNTDRSDASDALTKFKAEYDTKLAPIRQQLTEHQSQIDPLQDQADQLRTRLESIVKMPPMQEGEDPDVRKREMMLRVSQLKDQKEIARARTILNTYEPVSAELTQRKATIQPIQQAFDQLQGEAERNVSTGQKQLETGFAAREADLKTRFETADAVHAVRQSQMAMSLINSTLIAPTSPAFAQELSKAKANADQERLKNDPWATTFEPSTFEKGFYSGAAELIGHGLKGFAEFAESITRRIPIVLPGTSTPISADARTEGSRALADLILKVPGVMATQVETNKARLERFGPDWAGLGRFLGGATAGVGAAAADPAILVPLFFGGGYHGQFDAAEKYFEQQAAENPGAPRDKELELATAEKAGVLGGSVNTILALPFGEFGGAVNEVFGSTKSNVIANVLKASYESGGIPAVANDLKILQASILKTAGKDEFKEVAAKSLEEVIKEITRTPLQRAGSVGLNAAKDAAIFGAVQTAQNMVAKTYNPKTGLFENVASSAGQGAVLGGFFGALRQYSRATRAGRAETELKSGAAEQSWNPETGFQGREPNTGGEPGPGEPPGGLPSGPESGPPKPEAAHQEIDTLAPSEQVAPEQVQTTQHALRGLVKISQGEPMEALTSVERTSLEAKTSEGGARIEMVNGKPVITDATLARVRQIALVTAQLLPQSEEAQRQLLLAAPEEKGSSETTTKDSENIQATFAVDVQNAEGVTTTVEVQAGSESKARSQVAATIEPGQGLIRDVNQVTEFDQPATTPRGQLPEVSKGSEYVPPEKFESHVLEQISKEAGRPLDAQEQTAVRELVKVAATAYERWSKAFATVNATLQQRGNAGVSFNPGTKALGLSLPDLSRHLYLYSDPSSGEALVRHEAAHAVTTASGAKVVQLFKSAPESLKNAMKEAYRAEGSTDFNYAHELWAYVLAGKVELAAGRKIKLSGKFLPEQANRDFIVKYKRAFAEVLRFTRDIEGYLRRRGVAEDVIAQWKELDNLFVSKIKEVDANAQQKPPDEGSSQVSTEQTPGSGPRAPPVVAAAPEPTGGEPPVENPVNAPTAAPDTGGSSNPRENAAGPDEAVPGTELEPDVKAQLATGLNLPPGAIGHASKATSNGRTVNVAYVAQEASASRTSHDAEGRSTESYDQSLQPRNRALPVYRKQAQNIANNLDFAKAVFFPETTVPATTPEHGAPIMTRSGETLIGNGREIGVKLAYERNLAGAAKYRTDFIRNARLFGIDPATVRDMKQPILKRVILDGLTKEELVQFSHESNQATAMGTNATELAGQDAAYITPELLNLFDPNYALDAAKNRQFLQTYLRDVVRGADANEANLTGSELERRVRAAVFAYAYGMDQAGRAALERLSGDEADSGKKITNALLTVAPIVARMKTDIAAGNLFSLDISPAIARSTQDISEALKNKPAKQTAAAALKDLRDQGALETDPLEKAVLDFLLDNRTRKAVIEIGISNYVEAVFGLGNPKNGDLFGDRQLPTPLELFRHATEPNTLNAQAIAASAPKEIALSSKDLTDVPQNEREQYLVARGELGAGNSHRKLSTTSDEALFALGDDSGRTTGPQHAAFITKDGEILTRAEMEKAGLPTHSQELGTQSTQGAENAIQKRPAEEVLQREQEPDGSAGSGRGSLEPAQQGKEVAGEVGSGKPAASEEKITAPTLRRGENQGDLLSTQTEEFALVGQKGTDYGAIQAAKEKAIREHEESARGQMELFSQSISKLPARMQGALRGLLSGDTLDDISDENSVAKEGVARLAKEAIRRLREEVEGKVSRDIRFDVESETRDARGKKIDGITIIVRGDKGETLGAIEAERQKDGSLQVYNSNLAHDLRGEKQGVALYLKLIDEAGDSPVVSDTSVSESAARVWESLARRGIPVRKNPTAIQSSYDSAWRTSDGKPVFSAIGNPVSEQLDILENTINQELKAQETNDPLKQLMASIDTDILGGLFRKAEKEVSGKFETGRPDLALGAEGASIRAAHQFHTDTFEAKTIKEWDAEADRHLSDPAWARQFSQNIISRYLAGDNLLAWETRAAMRLIAADSHALGTPQEKLGHAVRAFAYARLRSKVGQELASGRDPFKTPEERGREFLSKALFRLKPEQEGEIEGEPDAGKRQQKLDAAMQERIDKLEKAFSYLAGKGITIDDIFNGSWELHGKGKKLIETEMARYDVRQQQALKLAQTGSRTAAEISKATGLSVADVERINDEFIDSLEKSLTAKVANGLTLENIDLQGALFAQPTTPANAAAARSPEEIKAEVRRIIKGMGFVASKDLGRFKVEKRKRQKLFVPPAPYAGPVPTSEPVPFEPREQGTLVPGEPVRPPNESAPVPYPEGQAPPYPGRVLGQTGLGLRPEAELPSPGGPVDERTSRLFNPAQPKLPNESAEVPYPEGQAAPYTGRVLGQTGLPLYQEMMIRKGVDMGSMDDLIKIGRVAQSLDAKPFDMVYEAWINNIFSGVGTHVANISGNTLSTAMDFTLQRGMEALLNTIYRSSDAPTFTEFKYIAKGILPGIAAGLKRGIRAWNTESSVFSNDVMNEQAEILEALDKAGGVPAAIPGRLGRAIRIPIRALLFEDELFKSLIGQMEVGAQAFRIAKHEERLTGDKLAARMNELISTPGSKAWARAVEKAIYLTYQEPTGLTALFRDQGKSAALGKMAAKAKAEGRTRTADVLKSEEIVVRSLYRAAGFFFPVIRTTYNIFKIGVGAANVLPSVSTIPYRIAKAGFYQWKDGKPFVESYSKARQISDLARQLIAWTTFATLWNMVAGDEDDDKKNLLLTGSMPYTQTKKGERELNERAHGGTYILRVGGRNGINIPYGRVEPIATVLGTVADTVTNIKKAKHGQSLAETGDALLGYFLAQAQSKTFLQGFGDLTKALEGSSTFLDVPKKLLMQAFVPNLIRQPLRGLDEWVRENKTAPAIYQTLPTGSLAEPKINIYGKPVAKGGNAFSRVFIAAGVKPDAQLEKADRLLLNWNREHPNEAWAPSTPLAVYDDAAGKNQKMTGPELTKFLEVSGRRAADLLRSQITQTQIDHPRPEDIKRIQQIFEDAHEQTKKEQFPKNRVNQVRAAFEKAA